MRMWMVNPEILCRQHLLGEHGEIHKHRHNFVKHHSIAKRIIMGQIEPESMWTRHDELSQEMLNRGYNHNSPYEMPDLSYLSSRERYFIIDRKISLQALLDRCPNCKKRYDAIHNN